MRETVYSICAMCTVKCPIEVEVEDGAVRHIWGNPHILGGQQLCPRGASGKAFEYDDERPQYPMIRDGGRGSGKWKKATWEEALDLIANKLKAVIEKHGAKAIILSDRGGPITDFQKSFIAAIGSPNYVNHHATCSNSVHNANMSVTGYARNGMGYDYKNCKHMVVYGRNLLESLDTGEARNVIDMLEAGGKMVCIDVRWNYTAAKADRLHIIRPGTDYALNLALINTIIREQLYDAQYVERWTAGFEELKKFTSQYTPEWAGTETGIPAKDITRIAHEAAAAKPSVIFHPGWMTAWRSDDFYLRRSIYALNAMMGSFEAKGGIYINKGLGNVGVKLRTLLGQVPKPKGERFDGAGTKYPHIGAQWGMAQLIPHAILNEDPYPVKAYIVMRHDPLASLPDPEQTKKAFDNLDLLVSIDVNYSETGWYSDVILPESTYLERTDHVIARNGLKPALIFRNKAVEPRFDSRPRSYIFRELAKRMGIGQYFPYETVEDLIAWQLEGTGVKPEDFRAKGFVGLAKEPIWFDRKDGLKFKTPSGKIEFFSEKLEKAGVPSFKPFERPEKPAEGSFRLVTSKVAVHTQGRTTSNNPLQNELAPENELWINTAQAAKLGIKDGDMVELSAGNPAVENAPAQRIRAKLIDYIHPEAVFMLHGFGDTVPVRSRSYGKGASDIRLQKGLLKVSVGGNCPLTECTVSVKRV